MKKYAILIGLNYVDEKVYNGWRGELGGPVSDANMVRDFLLKRGYECYMLLNEQATSVLFESVIESISKKIKLGDKLVIHYSGHGTLIDNKLYADIELFKSDSGWAMFDGIYCDDLVYCQLAKIPYGVSVVIASDSCHSGSFFRSMVSSMFGMFGQRFPKLVPKNVYSNKIFQAKDELDKIKMKAFVRAISGCQTNQYSYDNGLNGIFTLALLKALKLPSNYPETFKRILKEMPIDQTPKYTCIGSPFPNSVKLEMAYS